MGYVALSSSGSHVLRFRRSVLAASAAVIALCVALPGGASRAAPKAPPRPVATVIAFDESYRSDPNVDAGRLSIDAKIPLDPADVATFDATTQFDVSVGGFDFGGSLADDPRWVPGRTSATFTDVGVDGNTELVTKLRWTPTQLVVHVVATTGDDVSAVIADGHAGDDTGPVADSTAAEITFGTADVSWNAVACAGRVRTWTSKAGDDYSTVHMRGRAAQ